MAENRSFKKSNAKSYESSNKKVIRTLRFNRNDFTIKKMNEEELIGISEYLKFI